MLSLNRRRAGRQVRATGDRNSGVVLVEFALVCSLFAVFLAAIVEFGHVYMVINILNASAKRSARYGAVEGITSAQVASKVDTILSSTISPAQATTKVLDGNCFDDPDFDFDTFDPDSLEQVELTDLDRRELFVVRVTVPYEQVAIMPPFWVRGITLVGQSVMRHE
ncbi:TadE-like protein [Thalassoglobus neptunius]|uniref:TadE-like protein n=1 Tax=Thalassoglobus neptunius TaxID=1938619 RepID=A0A5C5WPJ1_9PLAN|nr:TadE/TadG family type IV pilus assembly protein [Thalassoglobus neptunius]TWT52089.1 TadE-like protein [Thalassoglobus neptunius]